MNEIPFITNRPRFFSDEQLARMEDSVCRILAEIGMAISGQDLIKRIRSLKSPFKDGRVLLPEKTVRDFLADGRKRNGNQFSRAPQALAALQPDIKLQVSNAPQFVHDPETDKILPFDSQRLIEAAKLVDVLAARGVSGGAPGCPADVAPALQPVVQYWIGAVHSRTGKRPVDAKSARTMPYVMDMADVLGNPVKDLPVYVVSPLTLGGESLECVFKYRDKISLVNVGDMSSAGCTVPLDPGHAFAVSAAEVIGGAILVRELTALPVEWGVRVCAMDLRHMAMVLGSPEDLLFQLANNEVNAFFHGRAWDPASARMHTTAPLPGAQSCAEKSSLMTAGALLGGRSFRMAGAVGLNDIFSPEQLVYDVEIKDHVERMVRGLDCACDPDLCVKEVLESREGNNFAGLSSTVEKYKDFYWHPSLFERAPMAAISGQSGPDMRRKAQEMVRDLIARHEYELEPGLRRELDAVLERAKKALSD